jgi:hypothetical protein
MSSNKSGFKVKFTCASKKNKGKVTLTLGQLKEVGDGVPFGYLFLRSLMIVTIQLKRKAVKVVFQPNRFSGYVALTAATNAWPKALRSPKVGKPVFYTVTGVRYV